jgi:hypothetical protein
VVASAPAAGAIAAAGPAVAWLLIVYLAWFAASWPISSFFSDVMRRITHAVTIATPLLLVLILGSALAHDVQPPRSPRLKKREEVRRGFTSGAGT